MLNIKRSKVSNAMHVRSADDRYAGTIYPANAGTFEFYMLANHDMPVACMTFPDEKQLVNFLANIRAMLK